MELTDIVSILEEEDNLVRVAETVKGLDNFEANTVCVWVSEDEYLDVDVDEDSFDGVWKFALVNDVDDVLYLVLVRMLNSKISFRLFGVDEFSSLLIT